MAQESTKIDKYWLEIPLLKAAFDGNIVEFNTLLDKGESTFICDQVGWTAAHCAAYTGQVAILQSLHPSLLTTADNSGFLPAHYAAVNGKVNVLEYLRKNNFSITTANNNGNTPLHWACEKGIIESVKFIIKNNVEQFNVSNKRGRTPLMMLQDDNSYDKEERVQCLQLLQREFPDLFIDNKTEHWKAFGNAIKTKGSLSLYAVQCMSIGLPRVGKTCLYYRIRNEQPPGQPTTRDTPGQGSASTGVLSDRKVIQVKIDLDRRTTKGKAIITGDDGWKEVNTLDEEIQIYIKSIFEQQQSQDSSLSQTSDNNSSSPPSIPSLSTTSESVNTPTDEETNKSSPPQLDLSLIDVIKSNMKDGSGNIDEVKALLKKSLSIFYSDCGGQPECCEVLPALVAGPTIFMLAFSLCEPLDSLYNVRYESSLSQIAEYQSSCTVKESLMKCLSSILSFHHSQSKSYQHLQSTASQYAKFTPPPTNVITVATHRDLVDEKTIIEVDKKLQDCVRNTALEKEGIIEYNTPERLIIPIDNYSEEDGPLVREVFDRIVMRENKDGESPYKVEIPIPWLGLDLFLRQQSSAVVSYDDCLAFYAKLGMEPATLTSCLWFLHHQMGTIRYFNDIKGLEDIVIADPSVIFMAATEFIVATFTLKNVAIDVEHKFHRYGLFKKEDVEKIFNKHKDKLQINIHQFVALFEHLNILGPAHSKDFDHFLPAALVHAPFAQDSKILSEYDFLMASFPIGFIALGIYSGLLAHVCSVNGWELMCDRSGMPRLFRDQATFIAHDAPVTIKATAKHLEFAVDYKINGGVCEIFSKVRNDLEIALPNVLNRLGYSEEFTLGFRCSTCISDCNEYHFAEVIGAEKPSKAKCSITKMPFHLNNHRRLWFDAFQLGSSLPPITPILPCPLITTNTITNRGGLPTSLHADPISEQPITTDALIESVQETVDDTILYPEGHVIVSVMRYTHNITDWSVLSLLLGLTQVDLHRIDTDYVRDHYNAKHKAIVTKWLEGGSASWAALVNGLMDPLVNRIDIANQITKDHPKLRSVTKTVQQGQPRNYKSCITL